ncbi:MAG: hypothetical protein ACRDRP_17305 [Pseudonocardiaceae bacterium]
MAELLNRLADSAESNQSETVGSWMRRVQEIQVSARDELMTAAVTVERLAAASWTTIGAAQDPPVSKQAAQQHYRRLVRRTDVNGDFDAAMVEPTPKPTRQAAETSDAAVNDKVDESSRHTTRRHPEPPRTPVSAGGKWATDDRRDLVHADDYHASGVWRVIVDGVIVGSVRPTYSSARTKRWTALINGIQILGGRIFPNRDKAAIQILLEHKYQEGYSRALINDR